MLGELLVLVVLTILRVFLQICMNCFEIRRMLLIGGYFFDYLMVLLEILGMLLVGDVVGGDCCGGC